MTVHSDEGNGVPAGTVLVVDDNPGGLEAIESVLRGDRYRIVTALSGEEALERAREVLPDVVLLDVLMPGMDGYEVCRRMRQDPDLAEIPIVMVTALDDRRSRLEALEAGADDFLSKPPDRAELRARVKNITTMNRYRKLLAERSKVEQTTTLSPDGIVVLDEAGAVLLANPAMTDLLAVTGEDALKDQPIWGFIDGEHLDDVREFHGSVLSLDDGTRRIEAAMAPIDSPPVPVEISAGPFPWEGERAAQWVVRDERERKAMEEQLLRSERLHALARMTGSIAHDFNNYLTAIVTPAELVLRTEDLEPVVREDLESIHAAGVRAASLCQQLLSFSRKRSSTPKVVDALQVVEDAKPMLTRLTREVCDLEFRLADGPLPVRIDPTHLEQIVVNLVVNARDALEGDGSIRLSLDRLLEEDHSRSGGTSLPNGRWVRIAVRDDGVGMDQETRRQIFDPFYTTKNEGTGLGLSTVHGIVAGSQGRIDIESAPGQGTEFRIFLPEADAAEGETAPARKTREGTVSAAAVESSTAGTAP